MTAEQERFAYGSILEALSKGLYPDKRHIIREFVQNAYDSVYELRKARPKLAFGSIKIKIQAPSIFISDQGMGMTETQVRQYRYLGFSERDRTKDRGFPRDRQVLDFRCRQEADRRHVSHRAAEEISGNNTRRQMMKEIHGGANPPLERPTPETHSEFSETSASSDEHFTFVELHGISEDSQVLMDKTNIKEYLSRTAPVPFHPKFQFE